jgi:23S rRNA (adenine2503-C2)-methyltransferase
MRIQQLQQTLSDLGARPCHIGRINRAWLQGLALDHGTRHQQSQHYFPLAVRQGLPAISAQLEALARIHTRHEAADASQRLLVELADGQMVESVLLPRDGLCVSSQVGCAWAVPFA